MPMVLAGVVSFALGAGLMWVVKPEPHSPDARASAATALTPPTDAPPDISRLAPADAAVALANWNYDRQNWPHAIEHYQEAIALGRDNADVRTDLGNCFRFLGQTQKALEQYETAQKQNPGHENSLYNQAGLFSEVLHDNERAKAAAREFIARFPQSPRAEAAKKLLSQLEAGPNDDKQRIVDWLNTRR